ncbi:MAG: AbrB/MazE/SpoVT family DNA-binding domain-containing protein [Anaerolineales bacterium]|nr:AbrB/MazE/SpoVT family DNA-binding domain-containing protein [Anaerolineales bacterium]
MVTKNKVACSEPGGSITLPSDILATLQLREGQEVWVEVDALRRRLILSPLIPAAAFWTPVSVAELSARQDVRPLSRPEDLAADFWPEEDSADDFRQAVRLWRNDQKTPGLLPAPSNMTFPC